MNIPTIEKKVLEKIRAWKNSRDSMQVEAKKFIMKVEHICREFCSSVDKSMDMFDVLALNEL